MFAAGLINKCPSLKDVELLGSDREHKIFDRFKFLMPNPKNIICKKHVEENIKQYLSSKRVFMGHREQNLRNIFSELCV